MVNSNNQDKILNAFHTHVSPLISNSFLVWNPYIIPYQNDSSFEFFIYQKLWKTCHENRLQCKTKLKKTAIRIWNAFACDAQWDSIYFLPQSNKLLCMCVNCHVAVYLHSPWRGEWNVKTERQNHIYENTLHPSRFTQILLSSCCCCSVYFYFIHISISRFLLELYLLYCCRIIFW